ncbi:hypothetical protein D3C79_808110 [compost metagenome]
MWALAASLIMVRFAVSRLSKLPMAALAGPSGISRMFRIWLVRVFRARLVASLGFSVVMVGPLGVQKPRWWWGEVVSS